MPDVEAYRGMDPNSDEAQKLARRITANVGDYASLRLILGIDPPEFARFYPDMEVATPSTLDTIDSFLDKFGCGVSENHCLGGGTGGYVLEETENFDASTEREVEESASVEASSEIGIDESVNQLSNLIKTKRYSEAIAFIESENLKNTEKSIYFAHQIRFLKKLKAISTYKTKTHS